MTLDEWRRVTAVNLDGAFLGVRSALRTMIPKKSGNIVLIASASGIKAAAGASASRERYAPTMQVVSSGQTASIVSRPRNRRS